MLEAALKDRISNSNMAHQDRMSQKNSQRKP